MQNNKDFVDTGVIEIRKLGERKTLPFLKRVSALEIRMEKIEKRLAKINEYFKKLGDLDE